LSSNNQDKYGEWSVFTGGSDGIGRFIAMELAKKGLNAEIIEGPRRYSNGVQ
jgi:short-subunit dehydrogenase